MKWEIGEELATWWRPNFGVDQVFNTTTHITQLFYVDTQVAVMLSIALPAPPSRTSQRMYQKGPCLTPLSYPCYTLDPKTLRP